MTIDMKEMANEGQDQLAQAMQAMQDEIEQLKAALAEKEEEAKRKLPDMEHVKATFQEGFNKLSEAVKPFIERADSKIGEPAREAMHKVEKNITVHPVASIAFALGAGIVIGKLMEIACRAANSADRGD